MRRLEPFDQQKKHHRPEKRRHPPASLDKRFLAELLGIGGPRVVLGSPAARPSPAATGGPPGCPARDGQGRGFPPGRIPDQLEHQHQHVGEVLAPVQGRSQPQPDQIGQLQRTPAQGHAGALSGLGEDFRVEPIGERSKILLTNAIPYVTSEFIREHCPVLLTKSLPIKDFGQRRPLLLWRKLSAIGPSPPYLAGSTRRRLWLK